MLEKPSLLSNSESPEYKSGMSDNDILNSLSGDGPKSTGLLGTPTRFDADAEGFNRYKNSDYYNSVGFLPGRDNEEAYGQSQTFGNVMKNAFSGAWDLTKSQFTDSWKGYARMADALINLDPTKLYDQGDLDKLNKKQNDIFDNNPIFNTQASQNTLLDRQFFGNLIQQSGFTLGTLAQVASEQLLTKIGEAALAATGVGAPVAAASELATDAKDMFSLKKAFEGLKSLGDLYSDSGLLRKGLKGTTLLELSNAAKAGASGLELAKIGVGGVVRGARELNMSFTEARMEAASTYGQLKGTLIDDYMSKNDGRIPDENAMKVIDEQAKSAAGSNFAINSVLLAASNRLQFDNLMGSWKPVSNIAKGAEQTAEEMLEVTGKVAGKDTTKLFEKSWGGIFDVAKTFGKRTAAIEAAKKIAFGTWAKVEMSEGIQELLQNMSNDAVQDYYKKAYDGKPVDAFESLAKVASNQANQQGVETFLSGALTGVITHPIDMIAERFHGKEHKEHQERIRKDIDTLNTYLADPTKLLNEHVADFNKSKAINEQMKEAVDNKDKYSFQNVKQGAMHEMVMTGLRTGKLDLLLDNLKDYSDNLTKDEFEKAFPGLNYGKDNEKTAKGYVDAMVTDARQIRKDWDNLNDKFTNPFNPTKFKTGSREHMNEAIKYSAYNKALEELSFQKYGVRKSKERFTSILDGISKDPSFSNSLYLPFYTLTSKENIKDEIKSLKDSRQLANNDTDRNKIDKEIGHLQDWHDSIDPINEYRAGFEGGSDKTIEKGYAAFTNYMKLKSGNEPITKDVIDEHFSKLLDIVKLQDDHKNFIDNVNLLANPKQFSKFYSKHELAMSNLIRDAMDEIEANQEKLKNEQTNKQTSNELTGDQPEISAESTKPRDPNTPPDQGGAGQATGQVESGTQQETKISDDIINKLKDVWKLIGNQQGRGLLEDGWADSIPLLDQLHKANIGANQYSAHGMGKSSFGSALSDLFNLFRDGIDPNRGGGVLYTAPLASEKGKGSGVGTASGNAYMDGAFVLIGAKGTAGIKSMSDVVGILVNSGLTDVHPEILTLMQQAFPHLVIGDYKSMIPFVEELNSRNDKKSNTAGVAQSEVARLNEERSKEINKLTDVDKTIAFDESTKANGKMVSRSPEDIQKLTDILPKQIVATSPDGKATLTYTLTKVTPMMGNWRITYSNDKGNDMTIPLDHDTQIAGKTKLQIQVALIKGYVANSGYGRGLSTITQEQAVSEIFKTLNTVSDEEADEIIKKKQEINDKYDKLVENAKAVDIFNEVPTVTKTTTEVLKEVKDETVEVTTQKVSNNVGTDVIVNGELATITGPDTVTTDSGEVIDINPSSTLIENGITPFQLSTSPVSSIVVDTKDGRKIAYTLQYLDINKNYISINNKKYRINRDETGKVVSLTYSTNNNIEYYEDTIGTLEEQLKNTSNPEYANVIKKRIALTKRDLELAKKSPSRTTRDENLIHAISLIDLKAKPELTDQDVVDTIASEATQVGVPDYLLKIVDRILADNYPDVADKYMDEGARVMTPHELYTIQLWAEEAISELQKLDKHEFVDSNIEQLKVLLNELENVKINKNGTISKRQGARTNKTKKAEESTTNKESKTTSTTEHSQETEELIDGSANTDTTESDNFDELMKSDTLEADIAKATNTVNKSIEKDERKPDKPVTITRGTVYRDITPQLNDFQNLLAQAKTEDKTWVYMNLSKDVERLKSLYYLTINPDTGTSPYKTFFMKLMGDYFDTMVKHEIWLSKDSKIEHYIDWFLDSNPWMKNNKRIRKLIVPFISEFMDKPIEERTDDAKKKLQDDINRILLIHMSFTNLAKDVDPDEYLEFEEEKHDDIPKQLEYDKKAQEEYDKQQYLLDREKTKEEEQKNNSDNFTKRYVQLQTTGKEDALINNKMAVLVDSEVQRKYKIKETLSLLSPTQIQDLGYKLLAIHDTDEAMGKYGYLREADDAAFRSANEGYLAVVGLLVDKDGKAVRFSQDGKVSDTGNSVIYTLPSSYNLRENRFESKVFDEASGKMVSAQEEPIVAGLRWSEFKRKVIDGDTYTFPIIGVSTGVPKHEYETKRALQSYTMDVVGDTPINIEIARGLRGEEEGTIQGTGNNKEILYGVKNGGTYFFLPSSSYPNSLHMHSFGLVPELFNKVIAAVKAIRSLGKQGRHYEPGFIKNLRIVETLLFAGENSDIQINNKSGIFRYRGNIVEDEAMLKRIIANRRINVDKSRLNTTGFFINLHGANMNYNQFLVANSVTTLAESFERGKPLMLNRYLNLEQPEVTKKEVEEAKQEEPKPVQEVKPETTIPEEPKEEPKEKPKEDKPARKKRERIKRIDEDEELTRDRSKPVTNDKVSKDDIRWFNKVFNKSLDGSLGNRGINFLSDVVNSRAWGKWTKAGITLFKGSDKGTLYHEAWHEFTQLYLTKAEKSKLYKEAAKVFGATKSNKELEEDLAEAFREHTIERGNPNTFINKIFNAIKKAIRFLFGNDITNKLYGDETIIDQLFDRLYRGDIGEYTPSISNIEFGSLKKLIEDDNGNPIDHFNAQKSHLAVRTIDALLYDAIYTGRTGTVTKFLSDPNRIDALYKVVRNKIADRANDILDELEAAEDADKLDEADRLDKLFNELKAITDNWEQVKKFHGENSKAFNISFKQGEDETSAASSLELITSVEDSEYNTTADDDSSQTGLEDAPDTKYTFDAQSSVEMSSIDGASKETRTLIRGLKKASIRAGKVSYQLNEWGFPELVDFGRTWNTLANSLSGTVSGPMEMIEKIDKLKFRFPEFYQLLENLPKPWVMMDQNIIPDQYQVAEIIKFWSAFSRTELPIYETLVDTEQVEIGQNERNEPIMRGQLTLKFVGASRNNIDAIASEMQENFKVKPEGGFIKRDENGQNYISDEKEGNHFKVYTHFALDNFDRLKSIDGRIEFLNLLGLNISKDAIGTPEFNDKASFLNVRYILESLNALLAKKDVKASNPYEQLTSARLMGDKLSVSNRIKDILDVESKYSAAHVTLSMRNPEGKLIHALSLNNALLLFNSALSNYEKYPTFQDIIDPIKAPWMAHFNPDSNTNVRNSKYLNAMFDLEDGSPTYGQRKMHGGKPITLTIGNYSGIKFKSTTEGQASEGEVSTKMYIYDKLAMDINNMFLGAVPLMRTGDKSLEYFTKLTSTEEGKGAVTNLFVPMNEVARTFADSHSLYSAMYGYLTDEMNRIKMFNNPNYIGHNLSYYGEKDTFTNAKGIQYSDKRGSQFNLFKDILSQGVQDELMALLKSDKSTEEILSRRDLTTMITNNIESFFVKQERELYNTLASKQMVANQEFWISPEVWRQSNADLRAITRTFVANQFIHHVEQSKLFFGDTAFFKDAHKRISAFVATGTVLVQEPWFNQWINMVDSREAAKNIAEGKKPIDRYVSNGKTTKTAVIDDVTSVSIYLDKWKEDLASVGATQAEIDSILRGYGGEYLDDKGKVKSDKMSEADAQGWVTLPYYRYFKLAQSKWYDKHEVIYQKIMNGEEITKEEQFYFMPVKAQYGGPLAVNDVYAPVFYKFSLMPLIPDMIKNTKLEKVNKLWIEQGIGFGLMKTGSKITERVRGMNEKGKAFNDAIYSDYDTREQLDDDYEFTPNEIYNRFLKEQVNIDPVLHENVIFPSQMRKLSIMNLFDKGQFAGSPALQALYDKYVSTVSQLTNIETKKLHKELGMRVEDGHYHIDDMSIFAKKIYTEAQSRDYNSNVLDFLEYDKETKTFKYPLDASVNSMQIQNLITSIVNNRIVRQLINGDMLVQGSGTGLERFTKPTKEQELQYGTNGLRFYHLNDGKNRTINMQVKVALTGKFLHLLEREDVKLKAEVSKVTPFEALNLLMKDEKWMNNNRKLVTMVGCRVPVQSLNSMESMEIAEFLPTTAGDIIILPSEIVAKSGGDFDIDKLFVFKPNIAKNGNHYEAVRGENDREDKENLQNQLISTMNDILLDKDNFKLLLSPNSNEQIQPVADKIKELTNVGSTDYKGTGIVTWKAQVDKFMAGLVGKATLGIAAVNNTMLQLVQFGGLRTNPTYLDEDIKFGRDSQNRPTMDKVKVRVNMINNLVDNQPFDGRYDMSSLKDELGILKSKFSEQMINAYVDVLNKDFISYVNAGLDVAGILFYMKNLGIGTPKMFYFINHPVVRKYVEDENIRNSEIVKKTMGKSFTNSFNLTVKLEREVKTLRNNSRFAGFALDDENKPLKGAKLREWISEYARDYESPMFLESSLKSKVGKPINDINIVERIVIMNELHTLKNQADMFRKLQTTINFDTNKFPTPFDAKLSLENEKDVRETGLFNGEAIDKIKSQSVISSFDVRQMLLDISEKVFPISNNKELVSMGVDIYKNLPFDMPAATKDRVMRSWRNDIILYILSNYTTLENLGNLNLGEYVFARENMFKSMAARLIDLKNKYPQELMDSTLFNNLRVDPGLKVKNIDLRRTDNSTASQDSYIEQFKNFMNFTKAGYSATQVREIQKFFKDLAIFGYFQSGLNKSNISFTDLIPNDQIAPLLQQGIANYNNQDLNATLNNYKTLFFSQNKPLNPSKEEADNRQKIYWEGYDDTLGNNNPNPNIPPSTDQGGNTNGSTYTNHSGGAEGGDAEWDIQGRKYGIKNNHYREPGSTYVDSKRLRDNGVKPLNISNADYEEGKIKATAAAQAMGRRISEKGAHYQYRNWAQVKYADAIFAISTIINKGEKDKKGYTAATTQVEGGTGYAVQMAIAEGKPVYVFDQIRKAWYTYNNGTWTKIDTPKLTNNFAGIGTREINEAGLGAIKDVYKKTFENGNDTSNGSLKKLQGLDKDQDATVNVYSGDRNGFQGLSNLMNGPVKMVVGDNERVFKTVEHFYQATKALFVGDRDLANKIFSAESGFQAQQMGKEIKMTDAQKQDWDAVSSKELETAMRLAFEQNPAARDLLLATGDRHLSHISPKGAKLGKWASEFPRILMKIRSELQGTNAPIDNTVKANIPQNLVSGKEAYGTLQEARPEVKAVLGSNPHSIDMIDKGFRTRTTRSADEMAKYNVKVGDVVKQFGKSSDGTTKNILTRVTAIHPKGSPEYLGTWNKEGWTDEGKQNIERFKDGAAAIEFEVIKDNKISSNSTSEKVEKPYPGVEVIKDSGLTVQKANEFIDILQPEVLSQGYKENKSPNANYMFSFGHRWSRIIPLSGKFKDAWDKIYGLTFSPELNKEVKEADESKGIAKVRKWRAIMNKWTGRQLQDIKTHNKGWSPSGFNYAYDALDNEGKPVPSMDKIAPITKFIESKLGIDLSNYDSVLANIYTENQFIPPHRDTTESDTAKEYPIVVINIGADGSISKVEGSHPNTKVAGDIPLKNGSIYSFGVDGVDRFEFFHTIRPEQFGKDTPTKPLQLPDGKVLYNYRITLTYRRVKDIDTNTPTKPSRLENKKEEGRGDVYNIKAGDIITMNTSHGSQQITISKININPTNDTFALSFTNSSNVFLMYRGKIVNGKMYPNETSNPMKGWHSISTATYIDFEPSKKEEGKGKGINLEELKATAIEFVNSGVYDEKLALNFMGRETMIKIINDAKTNEDMADILKTLC